LKSFYDNFHPKIEDVEEHADRATGERLLGKDPKSGKNVYARMGRYGAMIQIGEADEEKKLTLRLCKTKIFLPLL
jgi:DNA topoisomerase-1